MTDNRVGSVAPAILAENPQPQNRVGAVALSALMDSPPAADRVGVVTTHALVGPAEANNQIILVGRAVTTTSAPSATPSVPPPPGLGATTSGNSTGTSISVTLPTYSAGDLIVIGAYRNNDSTNNGPDGWTRLVGDRYSRHHLWYRVMNGSEGTTATITNSEATYTGWVAATYKQAGTPALLRQDWDETSDSFATDPYMEVGYLAGAYGWNVGTPAGTTLLQSAVTTGDGRVNLYRLDKPLPNPSGNKTFSGAVSSAAFGVPPSVIPATSVAVGQASTTATGMTSTPVVGPIVVPVGQATTAASALRAQLPSVELPAAAALTTAVATPVTILSAAVVPVGRAIIDADAWGVTGETDILLAVGRANVLATGQAVTSRTVRLFPGSTSTAVGAVSTGGFPIVTEGVELVILDPTQVRSPASLQVTVANTDPNDELDFHIDDVYVYSAVADVNGYLDVTSVPIPDEDPIGLKGTHTLKVTSATRGQDTATFTLERDMPNRLTVLAPDVDPVTVPGSEGRWVFQDVLPGGLGSWVMPIGPDSMTSPHLQKDVTVGHVAAARGPYQISELALGTKEWVLRGYYPDEAYLAELRAYAGINRRFYVIDHRGRAWKVAAQSLNIEPRKRQTDSISAENDWAGSWEFTLTIHDQEAVSPT